MATRAKTGSRNGIQWRTDVRGRTRYRAVLNTRATGKVYGPWSESQAEAKAYRVKALAEAQAGIRRASSPTTLREAWEDFIAAAKNGTANSRSRKPFKPSTLRGYERSWKRIDPELGAHKLTDIRRGDVQAMIDRWGGEMSPSTIRNTLDPLRVLYRRALDRELVTVNPTDRLDVPADAESTDGMRFASREEAARLLAALPDDQRAFWATAVYGGLRRGELRALRWSDVHLDDKQQRGPHIHVVRSWDDDEGEITPKTKGSNRPVPVIPQLRQVLRNHKKATGRSGSDLVFGRSATEPFIPTTVRNRALTAWKRANEAKAKELGRKLRDDERCDPITAHQCRHTCASMMIAAGANGKALSVVLGHASITITFDRYGHLMPGGEAEVGRLLAKWLDEHQSA